MMDEQEPRPYLGEFASAVPGPNYMSKQLENSAVVKTGDACLYGFTVTNTKASLQFVLVFDRATVPANGSVPLIAKSVPTADAVGFDWLPPRAFSAGIVICNSTTQGSLTLGAADCLFDVQYL